MSLFQSLEHSIRLELWFEVCWQIRCLELDLGLPVVNGPEWSHHHQRMQGVVVHKFRQKSELNPVILFVVAEGSKVLFHGLILALSLARCLGTECSRGSVINTHPWADSSQESAGKLCRGRGWCYWVQCVCRSHVWGMSVLAPASHYLSGKAGKSRSSSVGRQLPESW